MKKETIKNALLAAALVLGGGSAVYQATDTTPVLKPETEVTDAEQAQNKGKTALYIDLVIMDSLEVVYTGSDAIPSRPGKVEHKTRVEGRRVWIGKGEVVSLPMLNENVELPSPFQDYAIIDFGRLYK